MYEIRCKTRVAIGGPYFSDSVANEKFWSPQPKHSLLQALKHFYSTMQVGLVKEVLKQEG